MDLHCPKCSKILKNPIECKNCHYNFCEEHTRSFYYCPKCNSPFYGIKNYGIIKILEDSENERINKQIKMNDEIIKCNLCNFEGRPDYFCYHIAEEHKKELIEKFGKKKIYQIEKIEPQFVPQEIKFEKHNSVDVDYIPENLINQFGNIEIDNFKSLNSGEIKSNNDFFLESKNQIMDEKPLSRSQITKLYYCKKINRGINCDCCGPEYICSEGNCLCVKCMNYNVKTFGLKKGELYNKAGRIAKPENGEYHCEIKFDKIIRNSVGQKFHSQKTCSYYSKYTCKECEILNKYKDIYLDYISKNK